MPAKQKLDDSPHDGIAGQKSSPRLDERPSEILKFIPGLRKKFRAHDQEAASVPPTKNAIDQRPTVPLQGPSSITHATAPVYRAHGKSGQIAGLCDGLSTARKPIGRFQHARRKSPSCDRPASRQTSHPAFRAIADRKGDLASETTTQTDECADHNGIAHHSRQRAPGKIALNLKSSSARRRETKKLPTAFAIRSGEDARPSKGDCTEPAGPPSRTCEPVEKSPPAPPSARLLPNDRVLPTTMWKEVWIQDRWIPSYATANAQRHRCDHIKLGDSNLSAAPPPPTLSSV